MWWVNLGWLSDANLATLSLPLVNRTEGENNIKKLVGQDKDLEITYPLPSQSNQTQLWEDL